MSPAAVSTACSRCGEKAVAKVKLEDRSEVLMCRACVVAAKKERDAKKAADKARAAQAAIEAAETAADDAPAAERKNDEPGAPGESRRSGDADADADADADGDGDGEGDADEPATGSSSRPVSLRRQESGSNSDKARARKYKDAVKRLTAQLAAEREKHAAELAVAERKFDDLVELMKVEEKKRDRSTKRGTVRLEARATDAEQQVATLQASLDAVTDERDALSAEATKLRDLNADLQRKLASAGAGSAAAGDSSDALESALADARRDREDAINERDALQREFEESTETARKRLAYAAQLVVQLETKVEELQSDIDDKEAHLTTLREELDAMRASQLETNKKLTIKRRQEKALTKEVAELQKKLGSSGKGPTENDSDSELLSDDGGTTRRKDFFATNCSSKCCCSCSCSSCVFFVFKFR